MPADGDCMQISIAMATYNGERFLRTQLESLAAQTVRPVELVVSDDGSTDGTLDVVEGFAAIAPFPVRLLEKPGRLGFSDNFLHAAAACQHDLVAFCDQDDVWLPHKLETGMRRIAADDSLLALHRLTIADTAMAPTGLWTQGIEGDAVFEPLQLDPYKNGWGNSMLFRRPLATLLPRETRPRQPEQQRPLSHDTWIYALAAGLGRVSHIAEPLIFYRQHGANTIGVIPESTWRKARNRVLQPMWRLRERMIFYREMAALFRTLASGNGSFAGVANAAASRYEALNRPIEARLNIYDSPSLSGRMRAYQAMLGKPEFRFPSQVKDLVLGVAGLNALLQPSAVEPSHLA